MRGRDKLLEPIDGEAILHRQARRALATGCPVAVMVPSTDHPRAAVLQDLDVRCQPVPDATEGMSASIRAAARLCEPDQPLMVLLPDVPGIDTADLLASIATFDDLEHDTIVQAQGPDGRPGTPVLFPARLLGRFDALAGDDGARAIIRSEKVHALRLPDDRATRDLDTPEDWAAWRAETGVDG